MTEPLPDKRVIACNYAEGISSVAPGALAYVLYAYRGMGEHVELLVKSRGHRWIYKTETLWRLKNFRLKTIPPSHPRYTDVSGEARPGETLAYLTERHDYELRLHEGREATRILTASLIQRHGDQAYHETATLVPPEHPATPWNIAQIPRAAVHELKKRRLHKVPQTQKNADEE